MRTERIEASNLLNSLTVGQAVTVECEGNVWEMYVFAPVSRSDGAFGSYESQYVTVTFGLGRYSRSVSVLDIAAGKVKLSTRDAEPLPELVALSASVVKVGV